jgi:hypothetical protein
MKMLMKPNQLGCLDSNSLSGTKKEYITLKLMLSVMYDTKRLAYFFIKLMSHGLIVINFFLTKINLKTIKPCYVNFIRYLALLI